MWTTTFGHRIRRNQHCINLRSHLGSEASFVLNQLLKYNIRDITTRGMLYDKPGFTFFSLAVHNRWRWRRGQGQWWESRKKGQGSAVAGMIASSSILYLCKKLFTTFDPIELIFESVEGVTPRFLLSQFLCNRYLTKEAPLPKVHCPKPWTYPFSSTRNPAVSKTHDTKKWEWDHDPTWLWHNRASAPKIGATAKLSTGQSLGRRRHRSPPLQPPTPNPKSSPHRNPCPIGWKTSF